MPETMQQRDLTDPVGALVHDHGHLSALLLDLRATQRRVADGELAYGEAAPELAHAAEVLRDALVEHFAREEEALFPFIEEHLASLVFRSRAVRGDHEDVVAKAEAVSAFFRRSPEPASPVAHLDGLLTELEATYAAHSKAEIDLLHEVGAALDANLRDALRALLAGL